MTRIPSSRPKRWLRPPPQRTAYFSSARSPGVVLRVSRISAPVPSIASTKRRVSVAIPDRRPRRLSAVRSPVRTARVRPEMRASSAGCSKRSPSAADDAKETFGSSDAEDGLDRRQAADDARLLEQQRRGAGCVLGDGGLGRQVAAADVLGERRERDALQIELLGYDHRSSTGSCPGRWTTWPASSGSSVGQSARKCAPRLSVRVSAPAAISLVRRCGAPRSCSSPAASRTRPASCHSARRRSGVTVSSGCGDGRSAEPSRKAGLLERGEGRPAAEDEAFEQRVRREPVRSVNARCRRTHRPRTGPAARCRPSRSVTTPPIV